MFSKKRLQLKCFPVKFAKLLGVSILKNICKRLLLEVFYKKAVLKDTHREKVPSDKTPALRKSTNIGISVVRKSNQVFIRGS